MKYFINLLFTFLILTVFAIAQGRDSSSASSVIETIFGQHAPKVGMLGQVIAEAYDNRSQTVSDFDIYLLRLFLSGSVDREFTYVFQGDLNNGYRTLDLKLSYAISDHLRLDVGQFKASFGKEWLIDDKNLLFLSRSLIAQKINPQRQRGAQIRGSFFEKRFSLIGGVFNGNGQAIDNKISLLVARTTATPIQRGDDGSGVQLELTGSLAYSNDPNDLTWIGDHLDHQLLLSGAAKLLYGDFWIEVEDAAALYNNEKMHGFYLDLAGKIRQDVELALRADYLNYFSENGTPATRYFPLAYEKKYWFGINWYPVQGVKLYFDYIRDETFNTHAGFINLQYAINLDN